MGGWTDILDQFRPSAFLPKPSISQSIYTKEQASLRGGTDYPRAFPPAPPSDYAVLQAFNDQNLPDPIASAGLQTYKSRGIAGIDQAVNFIGAMAEGFNAYERSGLWVVMRDRMGYEKAILDAFNRVFNTAASRFGANPLTNAFRDAIIKRLQDSVDSLAQAAIDKITDEHSARKISIEMQLITLSGNPAAAVDLAKKSLPELSTPDAEKILLATADLLLKSDTKSSQDILIPLSKKTDTTGIEALRLLAIQQISHAENSAILPAEIAAKIQAHPLHTSDDALLVAELHILEKPEDKKKIIADLAASRYSAPTPEAIAFARWLNRRMDYQEAIDFIGKDRALSNSAWLLVYLDAHAGLDRWGDVFTLLDADTVVDLSDSIRLLFLARAAKKAGKEIEADDLWREMQQNLAFEKPEIASFVAAYTMRIGEPEQSIKAYRVLARRRDTSLEGYLGITRNWPKNDPAANLLSVYDEFLESFPNLTGQQVEKAYLELLAERDTPETAAKALSLLKHSPDSLPAISAAALGLLKLGDIEKANAIYNEEKIDWPKAKDSWKCIRVAVLQASGKIQEAEKLASTINKSQIRPEELKLLPTPQ
jgi:hypothetical protein